MLFKLTGKHTDVPGSVKAYAMEKTSKLPRFYNVINQIEVIIDGREGSKEAGNISVEIIARAERKKIFIAKEKGGDVYACIDLATHRLEQQLKKVKTKERDVKKHRPG